jgi:hypothetical protein
MTALPEPSIVEIYQGKTLELEFRLASDVWVYRAITAISAAAPAVITALAHGVPEGWSIWITGARRAMGAINRVPAQDPPYRARVLDVDRIELNSINATRLGPYEGGATLEYQEPVSVAGASARLVLRESASTNPVVDVRSSDTAPQITVDGAQQVVRATLLPATTQALAFTYGLYEVEITLADGRVLPLAYGSVRVHPDLTP